ncbi:hypothetical protein MIMGU_mgv11b016993mg [Erythranthe guttata]|uniref:Uncharacterized protein n=1 Tax=Erythranthe guttata TaxID=4155 RepID=A0A022PXU5_ERYGU|nr:hypothetical protein MIMGU_mgv11b016993mg [Erythranthe guttata]
MPGRSITPNKLAAKKTKRGLISLPVQRFFPFSKKINHPPSTNQSPVMSRRILGPDYLQEPLQPPWQKKGTGPNDTDA